MEKDIRVKIRKFLLENPQSLTGDYQRTSERFGVGYEDIRSIARVIRREQGSGVLPKERKQRMETKDGLTLSCEHSTRVRSLDDLVRVFKINLDKWLIPDFEVGTYEVTGFDKAKKPTTVTMYRTKAKLKPLPYHRDIAKLKKDWLEDIEKLSKTWELIVPRRMNTGGCMLEIAAYDLHLGKIGISGDEYSLEIAEGRMMSALNDLLEKSKGWKIDQIVFTVGNDFLNTDKDFPFASTTKGTPQHNSNSGKEIYRAARKLLTRAIDRLSEQAPVHVPIIPGNHDKESMFHLGDALDMYYQDSEYVTIDNSDSGMKSFQFGNSLLIMDHGDKVKPQNLPGVIMSRFRNLISEAKYIEVHRGHLHSNKKQRPVVGLEENEFNGLIVRNLSAMCATDNWHDESGYVGSIKRAQAFVWSPYNGIQAQLMYNVPV